MDRNSKKGTERSTATIDLGKERKVRIADFRAKRQLKKQPIGSVEEAVNVLVDIALTKEGL